MLLAFPNGEPFATGSIKYAYVPVTRHDASPRIVLPVEIEAVTVTAVIDTGSPYVVCAPYIARRLGLRPSAAIDTLRMLIRGVWLDGHVFRLTLTFPAEQGESLNLDVTAFVPDAEFEQAWGALPSFIGLGGCLERLRFAVDPAADTFYFGPLEA
jgi:hypothetical protein